MPVWHDASRRWVADGKLVLLGITQEQHPERCRLFAQWQRFDWPILHDPINVLGSEAVPILVAIDEHGIVRDTRPDVRTFEEEFLKREFPPPEVQPSQGWVRDDASEWRRWRDFGDSLILWESDADRAIDAYRRAIELNPDDAAARFRLGVSYRMRAESPQRQPDDFALAVEHWSAALERDPNQYIWRRRIQQYGPRLTKPYPFYDWVAQATEDVQSRGEEPIALQAPLSEAEIAEPAQRFVADELVSTPPDPEGRITRDAGLIEAEVTVVPPHVRPGESVRVHITLRPASGKQAHWTNDAGDTQVWIDIPEGWQIDRQPPPITNRREVESTEARHSEAELRVPEGITGVMKLPTYALYYVCEEKDGTCLYLRQDLSVSVVVETN